MFDRTVINAGPRYVEHVEKRAPTDESVRLLKEFEEKAQAKVIEAISVEGNGFNCVLHFEMDFMSEALRAKCVYDLNGHRRTVEYTKNRDYASSPRDFEAKVVEGLFKAIAEDISRAILTEALKKVRLPGGIWRGA